jgi:ectoine hydroxylase-related dioxygenase (phytanoyl-CoA dioxygenase family)
MAGNDRKLDHYLNHHLDEIAEQGFCVLEDVIEPALCDDLCEGVARLERELAIEAGTNDFEGLRTLRIYNLLAHAEPFCQIPIHPKVLPVVEGVLDKGCLVSTVSSIDIGPGETPQMLHSDDQVVGLKRPHAPIICNTMWALTDFSERNGATRLVPKSHRFDHWPEFGRDYETIPAEMKRGSVLVWVGSLWHGGGSNTTDEPRLGIAMNYCAGFIRQQENQLLGVPREVAARFPKRLQRMLGYGVYRNLIGHIDKNDPIEVLGGDGKLRTIWE